MTRTLSTPIALLFLVACTGPLPEGSVGVCLEAGVDPAVTDLVETWQLAGDVIEVRDGTAEDCGTAGWATPSRVVVVMLPNDALAHVGFTVTEDGRDVTPDLDLEDGDAVDVTFVHTQGWGEDHGLVVTEAEKGLVFAAEEGWQTDLLALEDSPLDGLLNVDDAGAYGPTRADECGQVRSHRLTFEADASLDLEANASSPIEVAGEALTARNAGSWDFEGTVGCTDTWGPESWVVYRPTE